MKASAKNAERDIERLKETRPFAGMSPSEIEVVVGHAGGEVRRFAKGEMVVYEGTKVKWFMLVLGGRLDICEVGAGGVRNIARVIEAGGTLGAMFLTENVEYYPGMVKASLPSEVLFLEIAKVRELWFDPRHEKFFTNLYSIVSRTLIETWKRMSLLTHKKAEDRFMLFLRWRAAEVGEADLQIPFPSIEACAGYLGLTRIGLGLPSSVWSSAARSRIPAAAAS